ncbi:Protein FAR1-related sequence 12 [Vitis vinifera]|uniref:Protein FAR1-related sequence 12 n=1 Tax=Vitis vinifera TaxID=29760 RepID=A0A438DJW7_VITVI|nr:Protein FAR1-related sequence 12 [Vitis vinifera]
MLTSPLSYVIIENSCQVEQIWSNNGESIFLGFDSDESDPDMQAEAYEDHERIEDKLPNNLDLCAGEDDKIVEQSVINREVLEPYIGMEFNSRDEAREFYVAYGRRTGFTVFVAKKYVYRKDRVLPPPPITREGCQAMIRLALRDGAKWVVTKFVKEHSHKLMSPSKVPWRGSGKHLVSELAVRLRNLLLCAHNKLAIFSRLVGLLVEGCKEEIMAHIESGSSKGVDVVGRGSRELAPIGSFRVGNYGGNGSNVCHETFYRGKEELDLCDLPLIEGPFTCIHSFQDEKDKRIRELSLELNNERQKCKRRCAAYEEQLNMILKDLEKHTEHMSRKVSDIVQSIREIEEEQSEDSDKEWS